MFKAGFSANLVIILVLPFTGVLDTFKKFEKITSGGWRYLPFAYNRLLAGPYCRCEVGWIIPLYGALKLSLKQDISDILTQVEYEDAEKRRVRRERNKLAASKCRKKRKDHVRNLVEVKVISISLSFSLLFTDKLSTSCVSTACSKVLATSLQQAVNNL